MLQTSADEFAPGTVVGKYQITRLIGQGGGGRVYEAVHVDLKKRVALKTLSAILASSESMVQRFLREGELATRIRHPHVVDVTDFGVHQGRPYLVMEFLEGEDLLTYLHRMGSLSIAQILDIMLPVIAATGAAHDAGVIHRDLKPSNVFLAKTQRGGVQPKLLDFGISKVDRGVSISDLTRADSLLGTPHYMSPEHVRDSKNIDARADQYALGVILYQLTTGKLPFHHDDMFSLLHLVVNEPFDPPSKLRSDLPPGFEQVVLRAMARRKDDRYGTVYALGAALLPFATPATRATWSSVFTASVPPPSMPKATVIGTPLHGSLHDDVVSAPTLEAFGGPGTPPVLPRERGSKRTYVIAAVIGVCALGGYAVWASSRSGQGARDLPPVSASAPATQVASPGAGSATASGTETQTVPQVATVAATNTASATATVSATATAKTIATTPSGAVVVSKKGSPPPAVSSTIVSPTASTMKTGANGATIIPD